MVSNLRPRRRTHNNKIYEVTTSRVIHWTGGTKKERRIFRLVASLDHFMVRLTLLLIALYVLTYGYFISNGITISAPGWQHFVILIPIWLIDGIKSIVESFIGAFYKDSSEDLSKITVVVPSKDGAAVLPETLAHLTQRFDPKKIIVVSNGSTDDTVAIAERFGVTCLDVDTPIGKVRAINYALRYITTPYTLLIDDDTLIGDARFPTGLLEKDYDAVAFRVLVNESTWITKLQMYEYRKSSDVGKRFHNRNGSVQNVSGAIGLFKTTELTRQTAHHTNEFAGEDLQRTLLLHLANETKGVVLTHSTVYTNPPNTLLNLFNQRTLGWFPGLYINFFNYLRLIGKRGVPFALRYDAFHNVFLVMLMDVLRLASLPVIIFYPTYFVVMYGAYLLLEAISYIRTGRQDPLWVVAVYPLYGLFGFITRVCAFGVFVYRRVVAKIAGAIYFDDYKLASNVSKAITITLVAVILEACLLYFVAYVQPDLPTIK